jgi:hypothetical protein
MIIIYDKTTGNILRYIADAFSLSTTIRNRLVPQKYRIESGEVRFPFPDTETSSWIPVTALRYSWIIALSWFGQIEILNLPLARKIVADITPVILFDASGNVHAVKCADSPAYPITKLEQVDNTPP